MTEADPMAQTADRPQARTLAEAYAFVELSLPPGEEWVDFDRFTTLHRSGDTYLLRFDGPYEGRRYTIDVAVPVPDDDAREESRLSYGQGRSTLIDAGQWCLLEISSAELARTGLAQLAGAPPDDETYRAIYGAWDAARAAADEVAKFLPSPPPDDGTPDGNSTPEGDATPEGEATPEGDGTPDGDDVVPETACWTALGQRLRADRPELFRRDRLDAARADYQRRLADFVTRYDLPDPLAEQSAAVTHPDPAEPTAGEAAAGEAPTGAAAAEGAVAVRTFAEAHLYLDLHPCVCGSALFPRGQLDVLRSDDAELLVRYAGPCDECGRDREFVLRMPQRPGVPPESPYQFSYPEDGPSEAIDAGQWLGVAEGYQVLLDTLGVTPLDADGRAEPGADPSWQVEREEILRMLVGAASALDEVLKFFPAGADANPPGADTIPASAFWTEDGREYYQRQPGQFAADRLTAERDRRRQRLADYLARYGR